jgi:hypothetical protein
MTRIKERFHHIRVIRVLRGLIAFYFFVIFVPSWLTFPAQPLLTVATPKQCE